MSRIRSKNTEIEKLLCGALRRKGVHYRKNVKDLPGKPDVAIKKYKLAVFVDSEYFHGYQWEEEQKERIARGNNPDYWIPKIERNMARDKEVTVQLEEMGYRVFRFWGHEVKEDADRCAGYILEYIRKLQ